MKTSLIAIALCLTGLSAHAICNEQEAQKASRERLEAMYGDMDNLRMLTLSRGQGNEKQFTNLFSLDARSGNNLALFPLMGQEVLDFNCQSVSHIIAPANLIR